MRQAPRRPGGAGKRPRRGSAPATPCGAQNALGGRAICYKLSAKTPLAREGLALFHAKETQKRQKTAKQTANRAERGGTAAEAGRQNRLKSS